VYDGTTQIAGKTLPVKTQNPPSIQDRRRVLQALIFDDLSKRQNTAPQNYCISSAGALGAAFFFLLVFFVVVFFAAGFLVVFLTILLDFRVVPFLPAFFLAAPFFFLLPVLVDLEVVPFLPAFFLAVPFFFLLPVLVDFAVVPFLPAFFLAAPFFFLLPVLVDFGVVRFLPATFGPVPFFFFSDTRDLLTFFAVFPEDFAPFAEDLAPFRADALEDFDLFAAEALAKVDLFTGCFFEVFRASLPDRPLANLPDRPLANFLLERVFLDALRVRDLFFAYFPRFDFLPFALFELFSQPCELKEGLPFVFGSMVEGLYSSFNSRRYCSWSSRTLSFT
jgi:hypothetical protein